MVVLHGCGGFSTFDHRIVTSLPGYGISTLDIDYFGPTPPPGKKGFCNAFGRVGDAFATCVREADDAATALHEVPGVHRIGTELYVYPNGSHNWPGRQGALGITHAATFLRRYLG